MQPKTNIYGGLITTKRIEGGGLVYLKYEIDDESYIEAISR